MSSWRTENCRSPTTRLFDHSSPHFDKKRRRKWEHVSNKKRVKTFPCGTFLLIFSNRCVWFQSASAFFPIFPILFVWFKKWPSFSKIFRIFDKPDIMRACASALQPSPLSHTCSRSNYLSCAKEQQITNCPFVALCTPFRVFQLPWNGCQLPSTAFSLNPPSLHALRVLSTQSYHSESNQSPDYQWVHSFSKERSKINYKDTTGSVFDSVFRSANQN